MPLARPWILWIVALLVGAAIVVGFLFEPKSGRPLAAFGVAMVLVVFWMLGYVAGHEQERLHRRLTSFRELELEAKLRIADQTIDWQRRRLAETSGYRGDETGSWRRPSA